MKKPENQLVVIPGVETVSGSLGISPERRTEMQKVIERICKEEQDKEDGDHVTTIKRIYDEFENPQECTFALYILDHAEENVGINSLFKLPEVVEEVEKA